MVYIFVGIGMIGLFFSLDMNKRLLVSCVKSEGRLMLFDIFMVRIDIVLLFNIVLGLSDSFFEYLFEFFLFGLR